MSTRVCKRCNIEKQYIYFLLNTQDRMTYKDEDGNLWHGRTCYPCFKRNVRRKSGHKKLVKKRCTLCHSWFQQLALTQQVCKSTCSNADVVDRCIANLRRSLVRKVGVEQVKALGNWLGCSKSEFRAHIERLFTGDMSWNTYGAWNMRHGARLADGSLAEYASYKNIKLV